MKTLVNGRKLRVYEAFAGIGTQALGLEAAGIDFETVAISDINEFSVESYNVIHGETKNDGDISKIVKFPDHDLFTYSFPCQDISNAGKQRGLSKGTGTRSSLLWECEKVIDQVRPDYLLLENVEALGSPKFKKGLDTWLQLLDDYGYESYPFIINARDHEIPQNRGRFIVPSIKKGIDVLFEAPAKKPLEICVADLLEENVDDRYFASTETAMRFISDTAGEQYDSDSFIDEHNVIRQLGYLNIKSQGNKVYDPKGVSPCLTTGMPSYFMINGKIRYLTPKEAWRLMGIKDEYIDRVYTHFVNKYGLSKAAELMYYQAGNAIVVNVLRDIFLNMFVNPYR